MLCEFLSVPCFVLTQFWDNINQFNSSTSCEQRCSKRRLDVPSFARVKNADWEQIYSQCLDKYVMNVKPKRDHIIEDMEICTFPIKAKYSFDTNEWLDQDSDEVLNLPWKGPETTVGPIFYPMIKDVLWLAYHDWSNQFKHGFTDGFKFQQYDSKRCDKFNSHFESVKNQMTYPQRHEHQELYKANANYLCKELSYYCVNLETDHITGPWEGTS